MSIKLKVLKFGDEDCCVLHGMLLPTSCMIVYDSLIEDKTLKTGSNQVITSPHRSVLVATSNGSKALRYYSRVDNTEKIKIYEIYF